MLNSTVQDENKKKAKTNPNLISLDGQNFEVIPDIAIHSSRWLIEIYQKLGRPQNPFTETGKKMMDVIITVWFNLYPKYTKSISTFQIFYQVFLPNPHNYLWS